MPRHILVAGAAIAGAAAAKALLRTGALVTVLDRAETARTAELADLGARVVITDDPPAEVLAGIDEVVLSPGFAPHHPLAVVAMAAGLDVYSEPELAWRMRRPGAPPWLAITGTNGKTTTTTMLAAILRAAGARVTALGNIGEPLVEEANGDYDVLAVELSSFQLHWSRRLAPQVGALLNLADDHLDWHRDFDAYVEAKTAIWRGADTGATCVGNIDDPRVAQLLSAVPGTQIAVTTGLPAPGQFGIVDGWLVGDGVELAPVTDVRPHGTHNVGNALHAAAMALSYGVPATAVRSGLAGYSPEPHRNALVSTVDDVRYVDDSKATNPHAALASLMAYPTIVWIAGGQLKGVNVDDLVARVASRLRGAVLLGVDRDQIAAALARHTPGLPVVEVASTDDGAMGEAVRAARGLARPEDTVLLAPAAASLDMYRGYAHRGDSFAAAVRAL